MAVIGGAHNINSCYALSAISIEVRIKNLFVHNVKLNDSGFAGPTVKIPCNHVRARVQQQCKGFEYVRTAGIRRVPSTYNLDLQEIGVCHWPSPRTTAPIRPILMSSKTHRYRSSNAVPADGPVSTGWWPRCSEPPACWAAVSSTGWERSAPRYVLPHKPPPPSLCTFPTCAQMIIPYRGDAYFARELKLAGDLGQVLFQPYHLQDEESIRKAVRYSNVVVNLVGRDWETKHFKFNDVHVEGARRIARVCREMGVERLIHVSALNVDPLPAVSIRRSVNCNSVCFFFFCKYHQGIGISDIPNIYLFIFYYRKKSLLNNCLFQMYIYFILFFYIFVFLYICIYVHFV